MMRAATVGVAAVIAAIPAHAQAPTISTAEAALVNCTISAVRFEDQLKAAQARIAELEKQVATSKGAAQSPEKK